MAGDIGTQSRLNDTVLGDPVNLASRLVSVNEPYRTTVLVAEEVREAAGAVGRRHLARDQVTAAGAPASRPHPKGDPKVRIP